MTVCVAIRYWLLRSCFPIVLIKLANGFSLEQLEKLPSHINHSKRYNFQQSTSRSSCYMKRFFDEGLDSTKITMQR